MQPCVLLPTFYRLVTTSCTTFIKGQKLRSLCPNADWQSFELLPFRMKHVNFGSYFFFFFFFCHSHVTCIPVFAAKHAALYA